MVFPDSPTHLGRVVRHEDVCIWAWIISEYRACIVLAGPIIVGRLSDYSGLSPEIIPAILLPQPVSCYSLLEHIGVFSDSFLHLSGWVTESPWHLPFFW